MILAGWVCPLPCSPVPAVQLDLGPARVTYSAVSMLPVSSLDKYLHTPLCQSRKTGERRKAETTQRCDCTSQQRPHIMRKFSWARRAEASRCTGVRGHGRSGRVECLF